MLVGDDGEYIYDIQQLQWHWGYGGLMLRISTLGIWV